MALVRHQGRPTLLLEDAGGELLARLLGQPLELTQFLRVAIGLAVSLAFGVLFLALIHILRVIVFVWPRRREEESEEKEA